MPAANRRRSLVAAMALSATAAAASAQSGVPPEPPSIPSAPGVLAIIGDLSFVNASGNTSFSTASVGDRLVWRKGQWTYTQTARFVEGETNNHETANEVQLSGRLDHDLTPRSRLFFSVADERNTFAGFRARVDEAFGLDYREFASAHDTLLVDIGAQYTEELDDDRTRTSYPAARVALYYRHLFNERAYATQNVEFVPDFRANSGRRVNLQTVFVAPFTTRVALRVTYDIRYESRPPYGYGTTDRLLSSGIQLTY